MIYLGWVYNGLSESLPLGNEADSLSYYARIDAHYDQNYFDSAMYYANRAIHFDKEEVRAYTLLGHLYQKSGNFDKALENYEKALKYGVNVENWMPYRALGTLYFNKGEYLKGIEYSFKHLQMDFENKQKPEYWTLFILYAHLGRLGFIEESNTFRPGY
jgi:tetratricopeptide (TPR) repeat protein